MQTPVKTEGRALAEKAKGSAIDGRTTRHAGYAVSQRKRKREEKIFGWMKTIAWLRKARYKGETTVRLAPLPAGFQGLLAPAPLIPFPCTDASVLIVNIL